MAAKQHPIRSDLAKIDELRDEEIDYSDIPELDEQVFEQPSVSWPPESQPAHQPRRRHHDRGRAE